MSITTKLQADSFLKICAESNNKIKILIFNINKIFVQENPGDLYAHPSGHIPLPFFFIFEKFILSLFFFGIFYHCVVSHCNAKSLASTNVP
jgi:hypothetical protein